MKSHTLEQKNLLFLELEKKESELRVNISPPTDFNDKVLTSLMAKRKDIYEKLMELAQVLPSDDEEKALAQIKRDFETPLSFADLTELFIRNNINAYLERTYLSQEGALELHQRLGEYFAITLKINQIQNVLQIQKEFETCLADEKELLEKRLADAQVQRSYYNPSEFPEFLVFEAQGKMRMYERQIRNLAILTAGGNPVIQMNMGDGKSQVISPIVALQVAKKGALPMIVVPTSLYATGKEKASDTLYNAFGNLGQGFEFSRETEMTEAKLELILHSLQSQKERQGYIYTTKENLLSFILKIQEVFYNESYKEAPNEKLLEDASKILSFIKTDCVALFDEIHELLDPNKEVNFTFGAKSTIDLTEADFVRKVAVKLLSIDELGLAENLQSQATEDVHHKIQENLVELFTEEFKKDYTLYFTDTEMMDVASHPKKNLLALAKQLFAQLLPYALSKKCGEHYGLRENQVLAIPYCANNTPTVNSEFSLRYETLLFTYFYYAQKGVDTLLIKKYVDEELASAISESRAEGKPIHETEISQRFAAKYRGLSILDDEVISSLHVIINSDRSRVLEFVFNEIAPLISTHEKKLGANGQDLFHMFKAVLGMTGTPWNDQSYPSPLKVYKDEAIDQLSQTLVLQRTDDQVYLLEATKAEEIKKLLLHRIIEGKYETFIDAGALIKGFTNKQFAENLLMNRLFKFNGVAFYDERSDELFVLEKFADRPLEQVPFEKCKLLKEERFTFYDQRHTTGSDIKQAVKAKALVTFSETTKKSEFYQSIWRMRGLGKGQTFDMVTTKKVGDLFGLEKIKKAQIALDCIRENES